MTTAKNTKPTATTPVTKITAVRDAKLLAIAKEHFFSVETLETRKMDGLDFHDVAVWSIRDALEAAYEAGKAAAAKA